jgi:hypothetical protein
MDQRFEPSNINVEFSSTLPNPYRISFETALNVSPEAGYLDVVQTLIVACVELNAMNSVRSTALMLAITKGIV